MHRRVANMKGHRGRQVGTAPRYLYILLEQHVVL